MNYRIINLKDRRTFVVGDIHGNLEMFKTRIANDENIRNCNLIIAGDIGLGFSTIEKHIQDYQILNHFISSKDIDLYLIRGNHDDPSYFTEHKIDMGNIFTLEDYTILKIGKTNILCFGGGVSVDRKNRLKNYEYKVKYYHDLYKDKKTEEEIVEIINKTNSYWVNEMPIYNEDALTEIVSDGIELHYIISHTSPSFCFKNTKKGIEYWLMMDLNLEDDLNTERSIISSVYNKVIDDKHPLKEWIYGHFHKHNVETINNIIFTALENADYTWDVKEVNLL